LKKVGEGIIGMGLKINKMEKNNIFNGLVDCQVFLQGGRLRGW